MAIGNQTAVFTRAKRIERLRTIVDDVACKTDQRKLMTGVSLVSVLLAVGVAALWWTLRR